MTEFALELKDIKKTFGDFLALDGVNMKVRRGTIHAILGENGAGKTTLMNILFGLYQPDGGAIHLDGEEKIIASPKAAMELGIGMIHQHFMLVESLTVAENIALGLPDQGVRLDLEKIAKRLLELSEEFGFDIDPHQEVWKLPIGMRQRVEIIKVLFRDADIIILDEPTSVLAPNEIANFLDGLSRLRAAGKTIIFITHKLDEVDTAVDHVTIIQHGKLQAELDVADSNVHEMAQLMVGRDFVSATIERGNKEPGEVVLKVSDLCARNSRGIDALIDVSLEVRAGEILGVAGVDGNGQAELSEIIAGLLKPISGSVTVDGQDIVNKSVHERRQECRVSFVPEDRHHTGLVLDFSLVQNAMLRDFRVKPFSKHGLIDLKKVRKIVKDWVERYDIRMHSIDQYVRFLSGGNQQKLVFAREVEADPRVLIVVQPCKGLDVGAIDAVQQTIMAERAAGKAILYISTEFEHIMAVADRISVICAGQITGTLTPDEVTGERIGALMGGIKE